MYNELQHMRHMPRYSRVSRLTVLIYHFYRKSVAQDGENQTKKSKFFMRFQPGNHPCRNIFLFLITHSIETASICN
jgi:hypothetical protein